MLVVCPRGHRVVEEDARFCTVCGETLEEPERRIVDLPPFDAAPLRDTAVAPPAPGERGLPLSLVIALVVVALAIGVALGLIAPG